MDEVRVGRRRVVAASVAVVAVVLVGLGAAAVGLLGGPDDDGPGVPDRLHAVPDHVTGYDVDADSLDGDLVGTDLRVGPTSAAWQTYDGATVLVGADDGAYHLLDVRRQLGFGRAVLSPDGLRLLVEGTGGAIGTLDLRTGETTYVREARAQRPAGNTRLAWSPDGRWAAWSGPGSTGRVELATGEVDEARPTPAQRVGSIGVADDGTVVVVSPRGVTRWTRTAVTTTGPLEIGPQLQAGVSASADGALVAVGSCCTRAAYVVDTRTGEVVTRAGLDLDDSPLATAEPLGWLDADTSVWQVMPQGGGGDGVLALVTVDGDVTEVGEVDDAMPDVVSVATGLMTLDRATVDRPAPDWPWSPERHLVVWGSSAAVLAIGAAIVLSRRRVAAAPPGVTVSSYDGPAGLAIGTVAAAAATFGWMWLVASRVGGDQTGLVYLFFGPAALVVAGVVMLFDRRLRWWGAGLVAGPPITITIGLYLLLTSIGS